MTFGWPGRRRELREASRGPVRALILGGGGARGAYEAGVVAALSEREAFDIVCGTSIGAVNGMFVAQGRPDKLVEIWSTISTLGVTQLKPELAVLVLLWQAGYGLIQSPFSQKASHALTMLRALPQLTLAGGLPHLLGMFEGGNVRGVIKELADLAAVRRTFIIGVTNLTNGRGESFAYFPPGQGAIEQAFHAAERSQPIHAANYVEAICASAALPPVYEPVPILCSDGELRLFADGGFTNNASFQQAIDAGATDITAIFVTPPASRSNARGGAAPASVMEIMSTMLEANTERMLELDLKLARRINDDVAAGTAPGKRHVSFRVIGPKTPLGLATLGFDDQVEVNRLFALGYADGSEVRAA
ncbi:MAG: patatin-like phospholipase family protein [Candidatus Elarobacter sp.]